MPLAAGPENSNHSADQVLAREDLVADRAVLSLDQIILNSAIEWNLDVGKTSSTAWSTRFLQEGSAERALHLLIEAARPCSSDEFRRSLSGAIAQIDELISSQVNAVLHHPRFQQLEASWRSLQNLVDQVEPGSNVKIRVLTVSWKELSRDQERAIEFDQSELFKRVYEDEFGAPGGEPYGLLVGDYEIHRELSREHPHDLETLRGISGVAAAAFAPFIASPHPTLLGPSDFSDLERPIDLDRIAGQLDFLQWKNLRETEDSRFVGLTLPRVLVRLPYQDDGSRGERFRFREDVSGPDKSKYLWGNAAYSFAAVVVRAFTQSRWFADIRGVQRGASGQPIDDGGLVTNLPAHSFSTDKLGIALKMSTDVLINDELERKLSELGFIPLCQCKDTRFAAFYSNQSIQRAQTYDRMAANANARLSAMLQYIFCVSRFAHYLKVMVRDKTGSLTEAHELERYLGDWLSQFVDSSQGSSERLPGTNARLPLREAQVKIREDADQPGHYRAEFHLRPHYELDDISASIRVTSRIGPPKR